MIIRSGQYYGLPKNAVALLEQVAQMTVSELLLLAKQIYDDPTIAYDGTIKRIKTDAGHCRLIIIDHACGYKAIQEWWVPDWSPQGLHYNMYTKHSDSSYNEDVSDDADWDTLSNDWGEDDIPLFWQAMRRDDDHGWHITYHTLRMEHPLMLHMRNALEYRK